MALGCWSVSARLAVLLTVGAERSCRGGCGPLQTLELFHDAGQSSRVKLESTGDCEIQTCCAVTDQRVASQDELHEEMTGDDLHPQELLRPTLGARLSATWRRFTVT